MLADTEIDVDGRGLGGDRELQAASSAWLVGSEGHELGNKSNAAWDQFAVNEQLAGGQSSYSDELYTTKLSDKQFTKEQLAMAERLAREIESNVSTNAHVAEERGQAAQQEDGDMDEEDKYSMVLREEEVVAPQLAAAVSQTPAPAEAAASEPAPAPAASPTAAVPATSTLKPPSKLRAGAIEFVPKGFSKSAATPAPPPGPAPLLPHVVTPPGAPPQGGMYNQGMVPPGGMMQMQSGMPVSPGMQQAGMMMAMSPEQQQQAQAHHAHAAQQQHQQVAYMQQQHAAAMQRTGMMVPMRAAAGMMVPAVMSPTGMGKNGLLSLPHSHERTQSARWAETHAAVPSWPSRL